MYRGTQFLLAKVAWVRVRTTVATELMARHSREMASASWGVRVMTLPLPNDDAAARPRCRA